MELLQILHIEMILPVNNINLTIVQKNYVCTYVTLSHLRSKEFTGIDKLCIPALLSYQGYI